MRFLFSQARAMTEPTEKEAPISKKSIAIIVGVFGIFAALALVVTLLLPSHH